MSSSRVSSRPGAGRTEAARGAPRASSRPGAACRASSRPGARETAAAGPSAARGSEEVGSQPSCRLPTVGFDAGPRPTSHDGSLEAKAQGEAPAAPRARASSAAPEDASGRPAVRSNRLTPTTLYIRMRPLATEGGHVDGAEGVHKLRGWNEEQVNMQDSAGRLHEFKYPTRVIVPESTQQEMYDHIMPPLVDAWCQRSTNVMVLAYGQTGTGKTHTMLGPQASLRSRGFDPEWGILPRVAFDCFEHMRAAEAQSAYILTASAVDFYMGMCCDLLNGHVPIEVDPTGTPLGVHRRVLEGMEDFYVFLDEVKSNRVTRATRMNTESSRSHCVMLLSLFKLDRESGLFTVTKFNLIDLAGSERADKTGERATPAEVTNELYKIILGKMDPAKCSAAVQGFFINMELFFLANEILRATEQYRRGKKYQPPRSCSTAFQRYTGEIMTGHTLLTTCICVSPAPQNGSENLFSLKWGQNMASLKAPINVNRPVPVDAVYEEACKQTVKAQTELAARNSGNKYWTTYKARAESALHRKELLEMLMAAVQC